jgi:hypothetical protein
MLTAVMLSGVMPSVLMQYGVMPSVVMLNGVTLSATMLSNKMLKGVMLSVVMLTVVAPSNLPNIKRFERFQIIFSKTTEFIIMEVRQC